MEIVRELRNLEPGPDVALTIGSFDGVHRAHRRLFDQVVARARSLGGQAVAITFDPHPRAVLTPNNPPFLLTTVEQRLLLMEQAGLDLAVVMTFDRALASLSARAFMELLGSHLRVRELVVGPNFALGRGREGTVERLIDLGHDLGYTVTVIPPVEIEGMLISSTATREALARGDVELAARMLGRPATVEGKVVEGFRRGRSIGFPTANIATDPSMIVPANGVYAVRLTLDDHTYPAVANIGVRPTFEGSQRSVEVHIFDFDADIYGRRVGVAFIHRLRDERKFAGIAELVAQIRHDAEQARQLLG
ncbi:MAG: bifunctional riboflavin kinase/FAD synthetase [Chloroflexi bacterium]|nr:bifunctional riboflavin kinase/FAD synthetase [Chloroflexota bacterium]